MKANGMKIEVEQKNNIEIKAYNGEIETNYMKEVK